MPMQPRPMADTWRPLRPSSRVCILLLLCTGFGGFWLGEHLPSNGEGSAGRRPSRIECEVGDHLDDLVASDAVFERLPQVKRQLVLAIARDQGGDGDQAAIARAE